MPSSPHLPVLHEDGSTEGAAETGPDATTHKISVGNWTEGGVLPGLATEGGVPGSRQERVMRRLIREGGAASNRVVGKGGGLLRGSVVLVLKGTWPPVNAGHATIKQQHGPQLQLSLIFGKSVPPIRNVAGRHNQGLVWSISLVFIWGLLPKGSQT